jgi:hypothetical protein
MRSLPSPSGACGRIWVGCLFLATVASLAAVGPSAVAAPATPASALSASGVAGTPSTGRVSWSVVPATATGPDSSRLQFDYGNVKAGSTIIDHVEVINRSAQSAAFSVYATDATGTTPQGVITLLPAGAKPKDVGSWTSFPGGAPQLSTVIPADRAVIETFTIKVPRLATPGDHTGAMVAAVGVVRKASNSSQVIENYRIGLPIEFRVPGPLHSGLQVQSISTGFSDPLNPFGTGTATISYTVANTGNVRLAATPTVSISGPFGQSKVVHPAKLPLILPGDSVRVSLRVPGLFPDGPMTAHVAVNGGWPPQTAPLPSALPVADGQASLFAFPWSLLGLILLLAAIGVGVWFFLRWRRRLHRAELAAVAARASRDTEQRLTRRRAAADGHGAANGHGGGAQPSSGSTPDTESAAVAPVAVPTETAPGTAEATDGTPDAGGPATSGTAE